MQISVAAGYAIHGLGYLGSKPEGEVVYVNEIAAFFDVSPSYLAKVFQTLGRSGFVLSFRGVKGGYALARPPQDINLREVVEAVDGPIIPSACCLSKSPCRRQTICDVFKTVNEAFRRFCSALEEKSVADLAASIVSDEHGAPRGMAKTAKKKRR
jgi:Rrf2 family transcriptional regulator, iron-sulfur cluster assembly transcription factor